jgi:DNA adenine methylase
MEIKRKFISPLRYPGGKSKISPLLADIILLNDLEGCIFYELYAGGAGASLTLLDLDICKKVVLNDLDYHIYAFWYCVLNFTEKLIKRIKDTEVTIENWKNQRKVYKYYENHDILDIGFSTFFLNRSNRSGILHKAGPIGGRDQTGKYKINARFNKLNLINRIKRIARHRDKIDLYNVESIELLTKVFANSSTNRFIFLDPPYYEQGKHLYLNFYKDSDHIALRNILKDNKNAMWFLTYDNRDQIHNLYRKFRRSYLTMAYTLQEKRQSREIMIFSDNLSLPKQVKVGSRSAKLSLIEA